MSLPPRTIRDGLIAGLLAGFVLAVLFYFYDLGQGVPLRTPAFLWGAIVNAAEVAPTTGVIIAYTLLHFSAWSLLGILAAALVHWTALPRSPLIGAAYGLFACSLVFYVGLVRAPDHLILSAPGWPAVFFGNALAGIVMFTHLHWVSTEPGIVGVVDFLEAHPITRRGLVAGLIGAVAVAAWFLLIDFLLREPFYTPAALASILFQGGGAPEAVRIEAEPVLGYSLVHFAFFTLFGVMFSALVEQVEKFPPLVFALLILFVVFEVFFIAMVAMLGRWILQELAWWSILLGNVLAAGAMSTYMWKVHPELRERLTSEAVWAD
jgi:hypothetical protein